MACASENDPSEASIDAFEGRFYWCICGDIAAQHRQKTLKRTVLRSCKGHLELQIQRH